VGLIRRLPLEAGLEVLLPAAVLAFACGSSSVSAVTRIGGPARWAVLLALAALALVAALVRARRPPAAPQAWAIVTGFLAVAVVSIGWSVDPRLTLERVFTLGALFTSAGALALCWTSVSEAATRVMHGVLLGIAMVAVAGLVVLVAARHDAVLSATAGSGWRFRGLGQNPNTVSMLLAIGLPLAVWRALAGPVRARRLGIALVLLFSGEIAVSGSRGALIAGFAGAVATALVLARSRQKRAWLVIVLGALAAVCAVTPKLQGSPRAIVSALPSSAPAPAGRGLDAQQYLRLEDELGHPPLGGYRPPVPRTFLGSSGRAQAWVGALRQGARRPVLGYGFGTENRVFVDRFYAFEGGFVENTYIGLFLQLGAFGLALFAALLALLGWSALWLLRSRSVAAIGPTAAGVGVLLAAVAIGFTQSGLLSVGNIAASSVWLTVLMLPLLAAEVHGR
jgi:hypothetical protein